MILVPTLVALFFMAAGSAPGNDQSGLTGTWIGDAEKNAAAIERGLLSPRDNEPITIRDTPAVFSITRIGKDGPITTEYRYDGTETKVAFPRWTTVEKVARDGPKVIITGTRSNGGEHKVVYALAGEHLVVEAVSRRGSQPEIRSRTYYRRDSANR